MPQESMSGAEAMGGGGSSTLTLAQLYAAGLSGADSTLTLDATRSGLVITASALADVVPLTVNNTSTDTTGPQGVVAVTGSHTVASGSSTFRPLSVTYTINQAGSASGAITGIFVNATETAVLGTHKLLDLQVGVAANNSRFSVAASGATVIDCTATAAAVPLAIKNGKDLSGIELQVTGTAATGVRILDTDGTTQLAVWGYTTVTNRWITGAAVGDVCIVCPGNKTIRFGNAGATVASISTQANSFNVTGVYTFNAAAPTSNMAFQPSGDADTGLGQIGGANTISLVAGLAEAIRGVADAATADTETNLLVRRNVAAAFTLQRVSMGAVDSGAAGFKLLRVPN